VFIFYNLFGNVPYSTAVASFLILLSTIGLIKIGAEFHKESVIEIE